MGFVIPGWSTISSLRFVYPTQMVLDQYLVRKWMIQNKIWSIEYNRYNVSCRSIFMSAI